eukprot:s3594_g16.t1
MLFARVSHCLGGVVPRSCWGNRTIDRCYFADVPEHSEEAPAATAEDKKQEEKKKDAARSSKDKEKDRKEKKDKDKERKSKEKKEKKDKEKKRQRSPEAAVKIGAGDDGSEVTTLKNIRYDGGAVAQEFYDEDAEMNLAVAQWELQLHQLRGYLPM